MNIIKMIKIGTQVTVHNKITAKVNQITIKPENQVTYSVAYVDENNQYHEILVYPHEITSKHEEHSLLSQCIS